MTLRRYVKLHGLEELPRLIRDIQSDGLQLFGSNVIVVVAKEKVSRAKLYLVVGLCVAPIATVSGRKSVGRLLGDGLFSRSLGGFGGGCSVHT